MAITYTATVRKAMEARVPKSDIFQVMIAPTGLTPDVLTGVRWDATTENLVFEFGTHDAPFPLDVIPAGPIVVTVAP